MSDTFERWKAAGGHMALSPSTHEAINAANYPGTRQLCTECDAPTGRCEDDTLTHDDVGPLCEECWEKAEHRLDGRSACGACDDGFCSCAPSEPSEDAQ